MKRPPPRDVRLDELEWLICNEPDRALRAAAITAYNNR